jgi:hypothetical protein
MPRLYEKCGFNRNTSRAVLAAPIELGGGGFSPLYVTAGTGYVTHFLKNWRTNYKYYMRGMHINQEYLIQYKNIRTAH